MTGKRAFTLDDADGAIVFREDGVKLIEPRSYGDEGGAPQHVVIMAGVFDRLTDPLFTGEMIAHMERELRDEED